MSDAGVCRSSSRDPVRPERLRDAPEALAQQIRERERVRLERSPVPSARSSRRRSRGSWTRTTSGHGTASTGTPELRVVDTVGDAARAQRRLPVGDCCRPCGSGPVRACARPADRARSAGRRRSGAGGCTTPLTVNSRPSRGLDGGALERRSAPLLARRHPQPPACAPVGSACTLAGVEERRGTTVMDLLISVVDEAEVDPAVAGGADIVDVKNPREGSLGANFPHVIRRVRELTPAAVPVSVAIGDFPNLPGMAALAAAGAAGCGVQFVKVGLLGPRDHDEAFAVLAAVCRAARDEAPAVRVMATAYADARSDRFAPAGGVARRRRRGRRRRLHDRHGRQGRGHAVHRSWPRPSSSASSSRCREAGLLCALAGSLSAADVPRLRELAPDIVGFRGAACRRRPPGGHARSRRRAGASRSLSRKPDPLRAPVVEQVARAVRGARRRSSRDRTWPR